MHLDEERLQRMLHDELTPPAREVARAHLESCDMCRGRLDQEARFESRVFAALEQIDTPPRLRVLTLSDKADARRRWYSRLIGVGALTIAGIAYAAPGSPIRSFLRDISRRTPTIGSLPTPIAPAPQPISGIALAPGTRLDIDIESAADSSTASIVIIDRSHDVVLQAVGGHPSFQTSVDRVVVRNVGGVGALNIDIPRTAPYVEVRVGGVRIFVKDGPDVTSAIRPDATGRYALPLTRTSRPFF